MLHYGNKFEIVELTDQLRFAGDGCSQPEYVISFQ